VITLDSGIKEIRKVPHLTRFATNIRLKRDRRKMSISQTLSALAIVLAMFALSSSSTAWGQQQQKQQLPATEQAPAQEAPAEQATAGQLNHRRT